MRKIDWVLVVALILTNAYWWYIHRAWYDYALEKQADIKAIATNLSRIESQTSHIPYDHQIIKGLQKRMDKYEDYYLENLPSRVYNLETKVFPQMHVEEDELGYDYP